MVMLKELQSPWIEQRYCDEPKRVPCLCNYTTTNKVIDTVDISK